jgi:hypothetical protein
MKEDFREAGLQRSFEDDVDARLRRTAWMLAVIWFGKSKQCWKVRTLSL